MGGCIKSWEGVLKVVGAVHNGSVQLIMGGCSKLWEDAVNHGRVY